MSRNVSVFSSQDVHVDAAGDVEEDVSVGLELAEGALVAEAGEGRVEEVGGERAHHAAEERLPRQLHVPVGRDLVSDIIFDENSVLQTINKKILQARPPP